MVALSKRGRPGFILELLLREVEIVVKGLEQQDQADVELLEFLANHVLRYIATMRVVGGCTDKDPELARPRKLLDHISSLWETKGKKVPPFESEEAMVKTFLESEDVDLLGLQFDTLIVEIRALRKENESVREEMASALAWRATESSRLERDLEKAHDELGQKERELERVRRRLEEEGVEINAEPGHDNGDVDFVAGFREQERHLQTYRSQIAELETKYGDMKQAYSNLARDRARLVLEVGDWRKKVNEWQTTLTQRVEARAKELVQATMVKEIERLEFFKAREALLRRIEETYSVTKAADGILVVPKSVLQKLQNARPDQLTYQVDDEGAHLVRKR